MYQKKYVVKGSQPAGESTQNDFNGQSESKDKNVQKNQNRSERATTNRGRGKWQQRGK